MLALLLFGAHTENPSSLTTIYHNFHTLFKNPTLRLTLNLTVNQKKRKEKLQNPINIYKKTPYQTDFLTYLQACFEMTDAG